MKIKTKLKHKTGVEKEEDFMKELKMRRFIKQGVALLLCVGIMGGLFDCVPAVNKNLVMEARAATISSSVIEGAISWGQSQIGSTAYNDKCQAFVWQCFNNGGFPNNSAISFASAKLCGDALLTNTDLNAPRGACVFFDCSSHGYGHIGISLGNGQMIHAGHKGVEIISFTDANYLKNWYWLTYRGWGVWGTQKGNTIGTPTTPNITVGTGDVTDITETNAVVRGTVNKDSSITSGMRCGVRIGTSANNFNVVSGYWEDVSAAAYNTNNGTSFPMWYNVNSELGVTLKKGTTYYYQMMASYGGKTYYGEVKSFRTAGDGTKPTITNYRIVSVNKDQFTVECTATDNVGVAYIKFLSWGSGQTWDKNGVTHDVNTTNGTATTTFKLSELKCYTTGTYAVDLRAYDKAGNVSDIKYLRFTVDRTAPVISNVKVSDCNATGYTVTCTVTDNIGVSKVQFPAWTTNNGQDDLPADWKTNAKASGTKNGNTYTYRVNVSDHKNELGEYQTKIYACDAAGNYQEIAVSKVTLKKETEQTNPADGQNPGNIPPSGPNNNQENTGGTENEQKDSTVTEKTKKAKIKKKRGTIKSLKNIKGKKVVLKLKKVSGATGYEVRYSTNKKFKKSVKKVRTTSLKVTLKKLKKGKKYYVKVRPYYKDSNGKYTYGKYSSVKKITIRK